MKETDTALPVQSVRWSTPGIISATLWGLAGSVMVLFGSFGVGWLPTVSELNTLELFLFLRTTVTGAILSTCVLTIGVWLMLYGWLRLGRSLRHASGQDPERGVLMAQKPRLDVDRDGYIQDPVAMSTSWREPLALWLSENWRRIRNSWWAHGSLKITNIVTIIWMLPLLATVPIFSRDIFAYVGQGRLVLNGGDPYAVGISTISNWFQLGTDSMWAEDGTPYGPVFIWMEALAVDAADGSLEWALFYLRMLAVAGTILCLIFTPLLAKQHGIDPARAQWLASANPLFLISYVASGHNDVLMVGFALAAVFFALRKQGVLAVIALTLSVGIKPITVVLLPFIGLMWAPAGARWAKKIWYWFLCGGIFLVLMAIIGYLNGYGFGWVKVMLGTGTGYTFWSPVGFSQMLLSNLGNAFGFNDDLLASVVKLAGRLSSVVLVLFLIFRGPHRQLSIRMTLAFTALVILSPVIHPWYLLWLLPFFAAIGIKDNWQLSWVVFTVAFLIGFGAYDQLHIWRFLELGILPKVISLAISMVLAFWMFFLDRRTAAFFDLRDVGRSLASMGRRLTGNRA